MIAQHPPPPAILVEQQMDSALPSSIASPPPHLHDTSDCGSSSGVGGMKDASAASDAASSSSEQTPAVNPSTINASEVAVPSSPSASGNFEKRPQSLSLTRYSIPPPALPPNPYALPTMPPPHPPPLLINNNDIFIHVQIGETLEIHVSGDTQKIVGPATVRMVGQQDVPAPTIPLPLHVPKGHVVHQLCDEQGFLRHIILSPETSKDTPQCNLSPAAIPSTSTATTTYNHNRPSPSTLQSLSSVPTPDCRQLLQHPQQQLPFYTVSRPYNHRGPRRGGPQPEPLMAQTTLVPQEPIEIDQEDMVRIKSMLSRIMPPSVVCRHATEVDVSWQSMDTSEANSAAPFPQIDGSEFSYQVMVTEVAGRGSRNDRSSYFKIAPPATTPPSDRSYTRITTLLPNRDYTIQVQALLEERGIVGDYSQPTLFKTPASVPDAPFGLKTDQVDQTMCMLRWNMPADGGLQISHYSLYRISANAKGEEEETPFLQTPDLVARVCGLTPASAYKFKVTASNRLGESPPSMMCTVFTPGELFRCHAVATGQRTAKVSWQAIPDWQYTVEQGNPYNALTSFLKNRGTGNTQFVNDLNNGEIYTFRVIAHAPDGSYVYSEWSKYMHMWKGHLLPTPTKPYINKDKKTEICWRTSKDVNYIVEGAITMPKWQQIYKGGNNTFTLTDEQAGMVFFRLMLVSRRSAATSEWSEPLRLAVPLKPLIYRIPAVQPPMFSEITKHSMNVSWQAAEYSAPVPGTTVLYELRRIDYNSMLLYSGPDTSFVVESLRPKQQILVQARIVAVDGSGKRREGVWSETGVATTLRDAPHPPHSLALSQDRKELHWTVAEDILGDVHFTVTRTTAGDEATSSEMQLETLAPKLALTDLAPGVTYAFQVVARCPWGDSDASETFHMSTAAEVPLAPEPITVEARAQRELTVRWTPPDARGSALRSYHVKVEHDRQIIREAMTAAVPSSSDEVEYRIDNLEPDTVYRVYVAASNDVGTGPQAKIHGCTLRPPPPPPALDGEAEPTQIKLKWRAVLTDGPSSQIKYRISRLADGTDAHAPCYEGEYCSTKIKGLAENTKYRFQIRSSEKSTGHGPWSKVFEFRTPFAPPPTIKVVPTATSIGNGSHTIEWPSVIPKGNPRGLFYRAQTHAPTDKKDQWRTVYEGGVNSFTLKVPAESSVLTRVFVVRPDGGTGIISQPSPPLNVSSIGETKQEEEAPPVAVAPTILERVRASRTCRIVMTVAFVVLLWSLFWMMTSPSSATSKNSTKSSAAKTEV